MDGISSIFDQGKAVKFCRYAVTVKVWLPEFQVFLKYKKANNLFAQGGNFLEPLEEGFFIAKIMKERTATILNQGMGQFTSARELALRRITRATSEVSLETVFSVVTPLRGRERLIGRGNPLERGRISKKRKGGGSGGWRRKVSNHDLIKKELGCESLGCDICNYRKMKNTYRSARIKKSEMAA